MGDVDKVLGRDEMALRALPPGLVIHLLFVTPQAPGPGTRWNGEGRIDVAAGPGAGLMDLQRVRTLRGRRVALGAAGVRRLMMLLVAAGALDLGRRERRRRPLMALCAVLLLVRVVREAHATSGWSIEHR